MDRFAVYEPCEVVVHVRRIRRLAIAQWTLFAAVPIMTFAFLGFWIPRLMGPLFQGWVVPVVIAVAVISTLGLPRAPFGFVLRGPRPGPDGRVRYELTRDGFRVWAGPDVITEGSWSSLPPASESRGGFLFRDGSGLRHKIPVEAFAERGQVAWFRAVAVRRAL